MLSKLTFALATTAVIGTAALTPSTADAHWRGYGWYGYSHSYWQHPHYGYGYGHYGYKPHFFGYPRYHRWHHTGWRHFRHYY